jgi:hypothetical protein
MTILQGYDGYPKTVQSAYSLLANWKQNLGRPNTNVNEGIAFATSDMKEGLKEIIFATNEGEGKADKSKITCHCRKELGQVTMLMSALKRRAKFLKKWEYQQFNHQITK